MRLQKAYTGFLQLSVYVPVNALLAVVFFILHNLTDFYGIADCTDLGLNIYLWLITPIIFHQILRIRIHYTQTPSQIVLICTLLYFFAIPVVNLFKELPFIGNYIKISFLLPLLFAYLTYILIRRSKRQKPIATNKHQGKIFLILIALILFEAGNYYKKSRDFDSVKDISPWHNCKDENPFKDSGTIIFPDIYYIVFDMHPSTPAVKTILNYNHSELDSELLKRNFIIPPESRSATNYTLQSMSAVWNGRQPAYKAEDEISFLDMYKARSEIKHNKWIPLLQKKGYRIHNASPFPLSTTDTSFLTHSGWGHPEELIINQTLLPGFWKRYQWVSENLLPSLITSRRENLFRDDLHCYESALSKTNAAIKESSMQAPQFVYSHFFIPHEGFKFDSTGKKLTWDESRKRENSYNKSFVEQLIYCRKLMIRLADKIQKENKRPAVIIFQGDHGIREANHPDTENKVFDVLNAVYIPSEKNTDLLKVHFYTPNTFLWISNTYFNCAVCLNSPKHCNLKLRNRL